MWPFNKKEEKQPEPVEQSLRLTVFFDKTCPGDSTWIQHNGIDELHCFYFKDFLHWFHGRKQSEAFSFVSDKRSITILRSTITGFSIGLVDRVRKM